MDVEKWALGMRRWLRFGRKVRVRNLANGRLPSRESDASGPWFLALEVIVILVVQTA